jgi:hypothetical protein
VHSYSLRNPERNDCVIATTTAVATVVDVYSSRRKKPPSLPLGTAPMFILCNARQVVMRGGEGGGLRSTMMLGGMSSRWVCMNMNIWSMARISLILVP